MSCSSNSVQLVNLRLFLIIVDEFIRICALTTQAICSSFALLLAIFSTLYCNMWCRNKLYSILFNCLKNPNGTLNWIIGNTKIISALQPLLLSSLESGVWRLVCRFFALPPVFFFDFLFNPEKYYYLQRQNCYETIYLKLNNSIFIQTGS